MFSKRIIKRAASALFILGLCLVLYPLYIQTHRQEQIKEDKFAALLGGEPARVQLADQTQFDECKAQGPLPDADCTPGTIFPEVTAEQTCVPGYSATARNVSVTLKKDIFAEYGIAYPIPFGSYEIDHLIPLALGGSNEIANLWPKSAEPFPGFYEKDITGDYLHEEVCKGHIALPAAQQQIAKDWVSIYNTLSDETIRQLKQKYKNWADRKNEKIHFKKQEKECQKF